MAENTKIAWTDHTVNFWWGCVEDGPECANCYARELDKMRGGTFDEGRNHWGKDAPRWDRSANARQQALRLHRRAGKRGTVETVFSNSMSDLFEEHPELPAARDVAFQTIEETGNLFWLLLTKRPQNVDTMVPTRWLDKGYPPNVMIGTTAGTQKQGERRVRDLCDRVSCPNLFVSAEPLVGELTLISRMDQIDWLIVGGESGPKRRAMSLNWARRLLHDARDFDTAFFFKQIGGPASDKKDKMEDFPEDLRVREFPACIREYHESITTS